MDPNNEAIWNAWATWPPRPPSIARKDKKEGQKKWDWKERVAESALGTA
jgi:hypothetical protein